MSDVLEPVAKAAAITYHTLREVWGEPGFSAAEICRDLKVLHEQMNWNVPEEARLQIFSGTPLTMMALAYLDGHVIGAMSIIVIIFSDVTYAVMENVVVHKAHRGHGIGRALFEMCEAYAQKNGAEWITLRSDNGLSGAQAFYRRLGFYSDDGSTTFDYDL